MNILISRCETCERRTYHIYNGVVNQDGHAFNTICLKCGDSCRKSEKDIIMVNYCDINEPKDDDYYLKSDEINLMVNSYMLPSDLCFILNMSNLHTTNRGWIIRIPLKGDIDGFLTIRNKFIGRENMLYCYLQDEYGNQLENGIYEGDFQLLIQSLIETADGGRDGYIRTVILSRELNGDLSEHIKRLHTALDYNKNSFYGGFSGTASTQTHGVGVIPNYYTNKVNTTVSSNTVTYTKIPKAHWYKTGGKNGK